MKPLIFKGFFFFIPKDMFTFVYFWIRTRLSSISFAIARLAPV
jgi:hypothetical protein